MHRGWRFALFAVVTSLGAAVYAGVTDGPGPAVFFSLGALAYGGYGWRKWREDRAGGENRDRRT